jgi:hypothetical protein
MPVRFGGRGKPNFVPTPIAWAKCPPNATERIGYLLGRKYSLPFAKIMRTADIEYFSPETGRKPILHCSPECRAMIRVHLKAPSRTHGDEATA